MNIYKRELRAHRKSLIIWSVSMFLLIVGGMGKYSASIGAGAGSFNELIAQMPKSLQNLMGVGVFDFSNAMDYFGILFLYLALMAAVHAVMLGSGIIAKEERDKTVEFLMVKPVSRAKIVTSKLLAALTIIIIFNMATLVSSYSMLSYYSKNEPFIAGLFKLMAALLCIQILFVVIGTFSAAVIKKPKLSSVAATSVMLIMYMVSIIIDLGKNIDFLRFFTIFKYFDSKLVLKHILFQNYDIAVYSIISVVLLATCVFGTYYFYKKRDLKI